VSAWGHVFRIRQARVRQRAPRMRCNHYLKGMD
jgi:hypothetical protein